MRKDDAIEEVQCVGLAVRRHELHRGSNVFASGCVQLAQPAIPGSGVNGVLARRPGGCNYRCGRDAARTKNTAAPSAGGWRRPVTLKVLLPDQLARIHV